MAKKTKNYELIKPDYADAADIEVVNTNMDKIDDELKRIEDTVSEKAPAIHNHDNRYFTEAEITSGVFAYQPRYFFEVVVDVANWQSGSTVIPNFPFAKNIELAGVDSDDVCIASLSDASDELGLLAIRNDSYVGGMTIYAKEQPTIPLLFNVIRVEKVKVS